MKFVLLTVLLFMCVSCANVGHPNGFFASDSANFAGQSASQAGQAAAAHMHHHTPAPAPAPSGF